jgi:hypothetical protein
MHLQLQAQQTPVPTKPYYIKDVLTGKIISRFTNFKNCVARCEKLQGHGFKVEYGSLLSFEEASERARTERLIRRL